MRAALCAAAIALLSTSLAAALAPQTARADVTATFDVSGTAEARPMVGNHCGDQCAFFGTLIINVTTGAATAVDITFPDLAAFDKLIRSHKSGTSHWSIGAFNSDEDTASLVFTTTPTPGSLVGFTGGSIIGGGGVDQLYVVLKGTIGDVPIAAVPEASTWAMMALGFGLLGLVGYRKTRSDNALA